MELSVITVTFNNELIIEGYLRSLFKALPSLSEVIIFDNGSSDKTPKKIKQFKDVILINGQSNLGFSRGNNEAVKLAKGKYLLFLNPDTVVQTKLEGLLEYLKSHRDVGLVAPQLIEPNGKPQPSLRMLPTIKGAFSEYYLRRKNKYEAYFPETEDPVEAESVVGAAMMISKKLFEEVGKFDERYFMYYEDLELCRKIRLRGLKIIYLPEIKITHMVGYNQSPLKKKWLKHSAKKYHGAINYFLLQFLLRLRP